MENIKSMAVKDCYTCLYLATHEKCDDCLTPPEYWRRYRAGEKDIPYAYLNWTEGNGIDRIVEWEKQGKVNIVIGGQGEAEVNVNWMPTQTLKNLIHVSEQCGYFTSRGKWTKDYKEIEIYNHGQYILVYMNDKLKLIKNVSGAVYWRA